MAERCEVRGEAGPEFTPDRPGQRIYQVTIHDRATPKECSLCQYVAALIKKIRQEQRDGRD